MQKPILECPRCGKGHTLKDCHVANGTCFACGEKGHVIANCPKRAPPMLNMQGKGKGQMKGSIPKTQGRVFALNQDQANQANDVVQGSDLTEI